MANHKKAYRTKQPAYHSKKVYCKLLQEKILILKLIQVREREKPIDSLRDIVENETYSRELDKLTSDYDQRLEEYRKKCDEEINENDRLYNHLYGSKFVYGQEIQLLHIYSGCTLSLNSNILTKENCCRELSLEEKPNQNSNFRMLSMNSVKNPGEPIFENQDVIIAFSNFDSMFDDENGVYGQTFILAVTSTINFGLRNGGGLGESLTKYPDAYDDPTLYWGRYFFDFTFFIIFNNRFIQIILGIILDTIGELRDERQALVKEIEGKCFICSQEKMTLIPKVKKVAIIIFTQNITRTICYITLFIIKIKIVILWGNMYIYVYKKKRLNFSLLVEHFKQKNKEQRKIAWINNEFNIYATYLIKYLLFYINIKKQFVLTITQIQ